MSGIRSRNGRKGHTVVPNWRWEDLTLNAYELRVAGWLASHADRWREDHVSRNMIAKRTGIAPSTVSKAVARLAELHIVALQRGERGRWIIEFDFDAWNESTESTGSPLVATRPVTGRDTTSDWSPHDHIEEQREQQVEEPPKPPASGGPKRRKRKNLDPLSPLERSDDFEAWWESYPRKVGKLDAQVAWRDVLGYLPSIESLVEASQDTVERVRRDRSLDPEWERFIPYPSTWLRRGEFMDGRRNEPGPIKVAACFVCGVDDPCRAVCQGVQVGIIGSVDECVWADR